jgi:hypothetical protein
MRDKQIEEMHNDVKYIYRRFLEDDDCDYLDEYIAVRLYEKGYRKASDVAREIFEEIEDVINNIGYFDEIDFRSLKKKYESEGI